MRARSQYASMHARADKYREIDDTQKVRKGRFGSKIAEGLWL